MGNRIVRVKDLSKKYRIYILPYSGVLKGLASQCKAQEKYKERLDLGVTWLK